MQAISLYSKTLSQQIRMRIKTAIKTYQSQGLRLPKLTMVLIGEQFASTIYVRNKARACEQIGMLSQIIQLPIHSSEANLLQLLDKLNHDDTIDGILVQLPLPMQINVAKVLDTIDPLKDIDGFHPDNMGLLAQGRPRFRACTPYGIIRLLATLPVALKGMHAVIIGASNIVGKPMMLELLNAECTVTICHIATQRLMHHVQQADLLISAIGKADIIHSEWIKPGAIVVDAGINRTETGMRGDIHFATAEKRAYAITPVPGGVGPMTVSMLLENTWTSYQSRIDIANHALKDTAS